MRDGWLYVPEQNLETVAAFCQEAGLLSENMDAFEIADRLAAYYQETIPYTFLRYRFFVLALIPCQEMKKTLPQAFSALFPIRRRRGEGIVRILRARQR